MRRYELGLAVCVAAVLVAGRARPVIAQARMSERGSVNQVVAGTVITVDYSRPQARGRVLFGELGKAVVHWGQIWTPGANWATTIELSAAVTIAGTAVPQGKYSVWVAPASGTAPWMLYLNRDPKIYHDQHPRPEVMAYAFPVTASEIAPVEILTFDFPRVTRSGTVLRLQWGTRSLELPIEVKDAIVRATLTAAQVEPYVGRYDVTMMSERGAPPEKFTTDVVFRDGHLLMSTGGVELELVPAGKPHQFLMGYVDNGEIVDIDPEFPVVFRMSGGRAVGIYSKSNDGSDFIAGVRVP